LDEFNLVGAFLRFIARSERLQDVEDAQKFDKVGIVVGEVPF
jgi:hypothetical protein